MRRIDAASGIDESVLIGRAGSAVAWVARSMLGGVYGRRAVVLAGPGNNGADGRVAATILRRWGVGVTIASVDRVTTPPDELGDVDLVIDAAYGTGFSGVFVGPLLRAHTKVLAVDIPSGVDGLTGRVDSASRVLGADRTVTFAALKPGLLLGEGASLAGDVTIADIGLELHLPEPIITEFVGALDLQPSRSRDAHKWQSAVLVVAGSVGMTGAAHLCARAAARAGAGLVRLGVPGDLATGDEIVGVALPSNGWLADAVAGAERCRSIVIGPGLGRSVDTIESIRRFVAHSDLQNRQMVIDADGLFALDDATIALRVSGTTVLTPHDGEFARLAGAPPGDDRVVSAQMLATKLGSVVLLKGPTTIIASPNGRVSLVRAGDQRLATAGSGDVLAGVIGAFLATGLDPHEAATMAALVHGSAALRGRSVGLLAGDLPDLVADVLTAADQTECR
jgi:ADP-dependent NAD(P)H-hydrate dehydratase / NAD(P)H-hydrate epimerase